MTSAPNRARFAPLDAALAARWAGFPEHGDHPLFPNFLGLRLEEVRNDYARMRLPFRAELTQPAGMIHGGALASLIDTVVVPAIGSAYPERHVLLTLDMHVAYMDPIMGEDAIAEGWVEKRGRSIVYCRVEVRSASGTLASTAALVYKVSSKLLPPPRA